MFLLELVQTATWLLLDADIWDRSYYAYYSVAGI